MHNSVTLKCSLMSYSSIQMNPWDKLYWYSKSTLFCALEQFCNARKLSTHLAWIWEPQIQQHKEAFFPRPEMMRNAVAQQSCRYMTPLLSRAGENPIHFQLLYSFTVDPVSKHKGEGIQSNTHTSSFHKTLGFNYLGGSGPRKGEWKWHNTAFKSWCWPKQRPSLPPNLWMDPLMAWTKPTAWGLTTDLETQQSLSVWKPTF